MSNSSDSVRDVRPPGVRRPRPVRKLTGTAVVALMLAVPLVSLGPGTASADTAPVPPVTVPTVSADVLPTAQINGVVYDQVIVGNTVYATGEFTKARPAGSAAGVNEVNRTNLVAYSLTTGALTSWAPTLNGTGKAIKASEDGTRIFVAGSFTQVSGVNRNRIAAVDATSGAVVTTFNPNANSRVNTIAVRGTTLWLGGIFSTVSGQARSRVAAVSTTNGGLQAFAPTTDAEVLAVTAPPGNTNVVFGGRFTTVNATGSYGMANVDGTTGALLPWSVLGQVRNAGEDAAIYSLTSDSEQVYGSGYTYGGGGNLEGTFAARNSDGLRIYVTGCRGDTYDTSTANGVLYHVGHAHDCATVGGLPQTEPWTYQKAIAQTTTAAVSGAVNQGGNFNGQPAPELLHWLPTLDSGTYTGLTQAAWDVTAKGDYLVMGGEFPRVNGVAQQGLVRMAVRTIAPNKEGPQSGATVLTPNLVSLAPGRVRVSWLSSWDRDNRNLTYEVLRGNTLGTSVVLGTVAGDSSWWNRPVLSFQDTTAPVGSTQTYRIRVKDALANALTSNTRQITVPAGNGTTSPYADAVLADGATHLWRLGEPSGTLAYDHAAADDLTLDASAVRGADGAMVNDPTAKATTFAGTAAVQAASPTLAPGPQTFSEELWFRTTTTTGGKLLGYGDNRTGNSNNYDRHIYMTNAGNLVFGTYTTGVNTVTSPKTYNDGQWHHVVTTLGGGTGQAMYVDGKLVGRNAGVNGAQAFSGYWKVGGDNIGGWPGQPARSSFAGDIEDVSVYAAPLTLTQVQNHYQASGRSLNLPARPTDAYGAAVWDAQPTTYWRLDETAGATAAVNRMTNEPDGRYSAGVAQAETGAPANAAGSSVRFPGTSEQSVVSTTAISNPTVFSTEAWFRTTSTDGGRIIGFGNSGENSRSGNYDRHVYMLANGALRYGIYNGNINTIDSPQPYNDGAWHQVVATQGPAGQRLYVDGDLVGSTPVPDPQVYTGYWRLGTDNTWGGANTDNFGGSIDEVAIYDSVLPAATVAQHWQIGRPPVPNQAPTAAFTSTATGLKATFDAAGSTDADGSIASYSWQFGDGTTGTGATPSHTYDAADTYPVVLTVTDDDGATATVTRDVAVTRPPNELPTAAFTSATAKLRATFDASASSDPDGTITSYAWDFGDGTTSIAAAPAHTYETADTYTVALTVTDDRGGAATTTQDVTVTANAAPVAAFGNTCTNLACSFDGRSSNDPDGTVAAYRWDFGDDTPAVTTPSATHAYAAAGSKQVTLTVTDDDGATNTTTQTVVVQAANVSPTAAFTSTCTALTCTFDGTGSTDSDGTIAGYAWDFGDGDTSTVASPQHSFTTGGDHTVSLTVTDNRGGTGTTSKVVTTTAPNQGPVAAFTADCTELVCAFDAATANDPDGSVVAYAWDFGDGASATGPTASHSYASGGARTVTLTVTDDDGATDSATREVTPSITPNQAPTAGFTATTNGLSASFDASASTDPDGSVVGYAWDFGDGTTGTGVTTTHAYATAGAKQVELTVTDDDGASRTLTKTVTVTAPPVNQPPTAAFSASCTNLVCSLDASASADADGTVAGHAWAFGDTTSGTGRTVSHTFPAAGPYDVVLTVTDDAGATASLTRTVTVTAAPAAVATDDFGRTVAVNWGSTQPGGAWTHTGSRTTASVADGSGRVNVPASYTDYERLTGVSNLNTDIAHTVWIESVPTGSGAYLGTIVRATPAGDYNAQVKVLANGTVTIGLARTGATLGAAVTVPGLTYTAGTRLRVRVQAVGSAPTTLRAKVWVASAAEPAAWQVSATDATAGYQVAGSVGVFPYLSGSATAPVVVRYDDLVVTRVN